MRWLPFPEHRRLDQEPYAAPQVQRINGDLVAAVGSTELIPRFFKWYEKGLPEDDKPDLGDSFEALTLTPRGSFQYYNRLDRLR